MSGGTCCFVARISPFAFRLRFSSLPFIIAPVSANYYLQGRGKSEAQGFVIVDLVQLTPLLIPPIYLIIPATRVGHSLVSRVPFLPRRGGDQYAARV